MSFVYPRTISVYRYPRFAAGTGGLGLQAYQEPQTVNGVSIWTTTPIYTGLVCSIQEYRSGQRPVEDLPGSTLVTPTWKIYIPAQRLPKGSIFVRDFVIDDLGIKYHVIDPYWNSLGYRAYCVLLET
jgi:hypothetical protein